LHHLVWQLKKSNKERDEHSKVTADTGLSEAERNIAEYKLRLTKREDERLNDGILKIIYKQQIFEEISEHQGVLAILHPTVKAGSLVLADLETVFKKLNEEMRPVGCLIESPTKERIQEIAREVRELRDKEVAHTSVVNR
jgi:hypothetical protein